MVRCADCGFLAARNHKTRELVEVEARVRERWSLLVVTVGTETLYDSGAICSARALPHDQAATALEGGPAQIDAMLHMKRECDAFTPWMQGFSPREHHEMVNSLEQRKWHEEQKQRELDAHAAERERDRQWQQEQKEHERKWQDDQKRKDRRWSLTVAVLVALLSFILGLFFRR